MPDTTRISKLRNQILKDKGLKRVSGQKKKLVTIDQLPTDFPKSNLMKLIEVRSGIPIYKWVFSGTIYHLSESAKAIGIIVDPTTISKWRKLISESKE